MVEKSHWTRKIELNPEHSHWYVQRFRTMAEAGKDLAGEARLIDAMAQRRSRILDAGCGTGRTGAELAARGHEVVGVDVDPVLIEAAKEDHPGPVWLTQDLAELDLAAAGESKPFDLVVSAGNVIAFLADSTRQQVLANLRDVLAEDGRIVVGFGAGRGYEFTDFLADADAVGLKAQHLFESWELHPWNNDSGFLVAVLATK